MRAEIILRIRRVSLLLPVLVLSACAAGQGGKFGGFENVGAGLLGATGLVSTSQAESAFTGIKKIGKAAQSLSDEEEYYLGRGVAAVVFSKYRPLRDDALNRYVNKVGLAVAKASDRPEVYGGYHFLVLDSTDVNALAAPGGFIFLTKGFVKLMPDEDALAGALAHEVAHVVKGHGVKAISKANLTEALLLIGQAAAEDYTSGVSQELVGAFGSSITDVANTIFEKGFSRSDEYDSDEYAVGLMLKVKYNPQGLVAALKQLDTIADKSEGGLFATHPEPEDRLDEVEEVLEDVQVTVTADAQKLRERRFKQALSHIT